MEAEHLSDEELAELILEARTLRDADRQAAVIATKKFRATHELVKEMESVQNKRADRRRRQRRPFTYGTQFDLPDEFFEMLRKHYLRN